MPGFFDSLSGLEKLSAEKISFRLGPSSNPALVENELANHILYSQAVPVTPNDTRFYLAVLCEALKLQPDKYYNRQTRRITIPDTFLQFIPDLQKVVEVYRDAFALVGVIPVSLKSGKSGVKDIGTFLRPAVFGGEGEMEISTGGSKYAIPVGTVARIPAPDPKATVEFASTIAKLDGKERATFEVAGGELGIMIDARRIG